MNCQKCKRSDPLNLVCFDQKCGAQQNLNLICCMCHSSFLIHHSVSLYMFLDIANMATQGWINSKDETIDLMEEIDQLILQLQEKKTKMNQYLQYYDKNKQKYKKLMNLIDEFKRQVHDPEMDDYEMFEETYKEIKSNFNFTPNNPSQPIKLISEQSYDSIKTSIQEMFDEFSKVHLQVLQIKDHNLRQVKQQQNQFNSQYISQNGVNQSNGVRNGSNYQQRNNRNKNNSQQNSIYQNNTQQNVIQQNINLQNSSNQSIVQQNKKQNNNQSGPLNQQSLNLYEPKELLDYDELFQRNCIDIGFKVVPKYVEERKNIEKSSLEQSKNLNFNEDNNSNKKNDMSNIKNEINSIKMELSNSQSFNSIQKQPKMEIEKDETPKNQNIDQSIKKENKNENSMDIEYQENNQNLFDKNKMQDDRNDKVKRDNIQLYDNNMQQISNPFPKNNQQTNNSIQSQQQQPQIKQVERKQLRSSSQINNNSQSQPTSLTTISQQQINISPEKQKYSSKNEINSDSNNKSNQRKVESSTNISQTNKQNSDIEKTIKSENSIKSEQFIKQDQQKSEYSEKGDKESKVGHQNKDKNSQVQEKRHQVNSSRRFHLNEEDQDLSSKNQKSRSGSEEEDDDDRDNAKNQNYPSGKKPKYIKKYDRKGQDYLKVLTEEQIDELIVDYNNLKNWREVEKKWGISKYHIIKYFKEQRYIINAEEDGEGETQ